VVGETPTSLTVVGDLATALALRTVVAAYQVLAFDLPRPRALLGEEHVRRIAAAMRVEGASSFRLSAAGRQSTVFQRLGMELAARTGLAYRPEDGDVLVRVRPSWEVLVRLTPRPLATRAWRQRDFPGALNATIAAAMLRLAAPRPAERFLNLMCGSGTLLAECPPAALALGLDNDPAALGAARANTVAPLVLADIRQLPLRPVFDVIAADLPYGERSGSHQANDALYRAFLVAAAEVAKPRARLVAITHDIRRFEAALAASEWRVVRRLRVFQKGLRPAIWLLRPARAPRC
jgi:tRNA (guanine6-N2)-methyltransferase